MPIWIRRFTFQKLKAYYEAEKEAHDTQQKQLTPESAAKTIARPNIQPTYTAKGPKK